jgi:hypothetical protein
MTFHVLRKHYRRVGGTWTSWPGLLLDFGSECVVRGWGGTLLAVM